MARSSIDVGIDLGTTNSAVAVIQQGSPFVVRDGMQTTTPSVVRILKSGTVMVGQKPYDLLEHDPSNVASEFKRWMGTREARSFRDSGVEMTATQLSAEVLKTLRNNVERYLGETIRSAVITVPAAFDLTQCAATQDAAAMAGIEHAPLLQEPIAASLAYGYRLDMEGRNWLVYDLGGGTFDLALVGVANGRIQVLDHEGDNHLGGKDFDRDLLDHVLLPILAREFAIDSFFADPRNRRTELAKLRYLAERAKIDLSTFDEIPVIIESTREPMLDDEGREIETEVLVGRADYEVAVRSRIARTVKLSKTLLDRNRSVEVDAVLMVGGPTLTPLVRQMVEGGLGIPVKAAADPMTVVAEGAALYAATQPLRREHRRIAQHADVITLDLAYNSVTNDDSMLIGANVPDQIESLEVLANDGSWDSGRIPVRGGRFTARIPLLQPGAHTFQIRAFKSDGASVPIDPDSITVARGLTASAAPLSKSLGVVVAAEDGTGEPVVEHLIYKGSHLPARAVREYRTTVALEPGGATEILQVYVVEGENLIPARNRKVAEVSISDVDVDRRIPSGNPIEVSIEVDESRILTVSAYLPIVDKTFAANIAMGYEEIALADLARDITIEHQRVQALAELVPAAESREIFSELREVAGDVQSAESGDEDASQRALRRLQEIQERIDAIEATQRFPMAVAEARESSEATAEVLLDVGEEGDRARLRALTDELDTAIEERNLQEIRRISERMDRLRFEVIARHPGFWIGFFMHLVENQPNWTDPVQAQYLVRVGRQQVLAEDAYGLRNTVHELYELVPPDDTGLVAQFANVGIRR